MSFTQTELFELYALKSHDNALLSWTTEGWEWDIKTLRPWVLKVEIGSINNLYFTGTLLIL